MANITRFDPFAELASFRPFSEPRRILPGLSPAWLDEAQVEPGSGGRRGKADTAYSVKAEIPGVKKEDIHVAIDGNQVSIEAEVKGKRKRKRARKSSAASAISASSYR
ncbi:MAG: Hsp20 family protein, partial [Betaproteobacteria bacterium]|nr:Hsp20 family protein [Betaproteobacteria bacterium]